MEILQSAIDLSRLQFAFVVSFHAIFPVFSIGIASFVALLEALFYKTQNPVYARLSEFWTKVFAIAFGMGVVSGIVMSFQFGTNWSNFAYATANFLGPVLSYEVITAFFLEAAFLGVLLFGREKVPSGVHLFAAIMVAVGTFISSFWILAANSWLHTPAGVEVVDGVFHVRDWAAAIFNPSFPYRFAHMGIASFLTGAFVVAGVSSWFLIRGRDALAHRKALSMCLWLILFLAPAQVVMGDLHGLNTLEHQPAKIAAMEGNWETSSNVPLLLFALPSNETQSNSFELGVPNMASIILKHDPEGIVPGLNETPAHEQPPVAAVFWSFRVMVGLGMLMVLAGIAGLISRFRKNLYTPSVFHHFLVAMIPAPFIAVVAGWFVTEMGRSPWLVYGMMTQAEGITPSLTPGLALASLIGFGVVYGIVYASGLVYIIKTVRKGTDNESGV
jgi:cytochrome d ubiquinol oxidase subunit I